MNLKKIFFVVLILSLLVLVSYISVVLAENLAKEEAKKSDMIFVEDSKPEENSIRIIEITEERSDLNEERKRSIIEVQELNRDREYYFETKNYYKYDWEEDDYWYYKKYIDEYDLEIVVVDDLTRNRIENAYVRAKGLDYETGYTGQDGTIEFRNLREDCYSVKVEADGYDIDYINVCLEDNKKRSVYLKT